MPFTPFDLQPGEQQQRITDPSAPEGQFVFELGYRGDGGDARLNLGDSHQVEQTVVLPVGVELIRPVVIISARDTVALGLAWELSALLNGVKVYERKFTQLPPNTRRLDDIAIPLNEANGAPGTDDLAFRLTLVNI